MVASAEFAALSSGDLVSLGVHEVAGVRDGLEAYTPQDLVPSSLASAQAE